MPILQNMNCRCLMLHFCVLFSCGTEVKAAHRLNVNQCSSVMMSDSASERQDSVSQRQVSASQRQDSASQRQDSASQRQDSVSQRQDSASQRQDSVSQRQDSASQRAWFSKEPFILTYVELEAEVDMT